MRRSQRKCENEGLNERLGQQVVLLYKVIRAKVRQRKAWDMQEIGTRSGESVYMMERDRRKSSAVGR